MVKLLLAYGVDPDITNADGLTPIDLAHRKDRSHLARLMEADIDKKLSCDAKGRLTNRTDYVTTLYGYDANNNPTTVVENSNTNTWTYDAYNRVSSYRDTSGNLIQYRYDANRNITNLVYPGGKNVYYDFRGSTIALSGDNGLVTDRMEYSAYGSATYRVGTNDTPFLFNGRYGVMTDPNGLLYMRARYYNQFLCRFINPDPSGFVGGLNLYAYANGNPINLLDPFGLNVGTTGDTSFNWTGNLMIVLEFRS